MNGVWLSELPIGVLGILIVGGTVGVSLLGLWATRRFLKPYADAHNDLAAALFAMLGVTYAVLLGMVAIAAWERFEHADATVTREAGAVIELYRHFDGYPQPLQGQLEGRIRAYVDATIAEDWPAMRRDEVLPRTTSEVDQLARALVTFEPLTRGQQVLHQSTLSQLDGFLEARAERLVAARQGLPGLMWLVLVIGVAITIGFTSFFWAASLRMHALMTAATAAAIGLVFFLVVALDHPLWGTLSVDDDAFRQARDSLAQLDSRSR